jgi:hypothetical protein
MLTDSIGICLQRSTSAPTEMTNASPTIRATEGSSPIPVLPVWSACSSCGAIALYRRGVGAV